MDRKLKDLSTEVTSTSSDEQKKAFTKCNKMADNSVENCPKVSFLMETMAKLGCPIKSSYVECRSCDGDFNGGFQINPKTQEPQVILCHNHIQDQDWMDRTLTHEILHAFDHCRAKLDWKNCDHHACTEVRAAALSGDCDWSLEARRGNYTIAKQHQACVKRRAELSLAFNDACKGKERDCVEKVFESCYNDTTPFPHIP